MHPPRRDKSHTADRSEVYLQFKPPQIIQIVVVRSAFFNR